MHRIWRGRCFNQGNENARKKLKEVSIPTERPQVVYDGRGEDLWEILKVVDLVKQWKDYCLFKVAEERCWR